MPANERQGHEGDIKSKSLQREIDRPKTLKDLAITDNQSSQYQQMAAIPEDEFERGLEQRSGQDGTRELF